MTELKRTTNLAWRRFLATEAGMEGMLYLREKMPSVARGDSSAMIFDSGKGQGWRECLDAISDIISNVENKTDNFDNP